MPVIFTELVSLGLARYVYCAEEIDAMRSARKRIALIVFMVSVPFQLAISARRSIWRPPINIICVRLDRVIRLTWKQERPRCLVVRSPSQRIGRTAVCNGEFYHVQAVIRCHMAGVDRCCDRFVFGSRICGLRITLTSGHQCYK